MTDSPTVPGTNDSSNGPGGAAGPGGPDRPHRHYSRGMVILLAAASAVVLLLVGATAGLALSGRLGNSAPATPDTASVDAGFARDMIVHHDQGVLMAHYAEQNTTDSEIAVMAYDLGYTQTDQIGQMQGWLSLWDLPESGDGTHMGWMGSTGDDHGGMVMTSSAAGSAGTSSAQVPLMPGMATSDEIAKLKSLSGAESDTYFLQLMIRHHQGGAPMMAYAEQHATNPVVRNFAGKMLVSQT